MWTAGVDRGFHVAPQLAEARDLAEADLDAVEKLYEADTAAYAAAYEATAQAVLRERGLEVDVEITRAPGGLARDDLAVEVAEIARSRTALPMTGQAPDWTTGATAAALRAAGLTYTERLAQSTHHDTRDEQQLTSPTPSRPASRSTTSST